jgi:Transposase DNA-binding/Transposase DDE domain
MIASEWLSSDVATEFVGAKLGDPRREKRLIRISSRVGEDPKLSFPDLFSSSAELEGFYRFLRNESFDWTGVLDPHFAATHRRAAQLGEVLVIHDTTEFTFKGTRHGLGPTSTSAEGFFAHASLVVALDEARTPLGMGALQIYARSTRKGRRLTRERLNDETSEGRRWLKGAAAVEERCAERFSAIHVADREGDSYPFMSGIEKLGGRFVIRVAHDRRVIDKDEEHLRLHEVVAGLKARTSFQIQLSARGNPLNPTAAKVHPKRSKRAAIVCVAAASTTIAVPNAHPKTEATIPLNIVRLWEPTPPRGEPPVEWMLWTTEPIDTVANLRRIIDIYRSRWVVEEFFKAIKTGCQFEKRQLESVETLSTALAVFIPVAWKLLLARSVAQHNPMWPPTSILSPLQVTYLEQHFGKPITSAAAALAAMAKLGGHLTQNGKPGWQTLARGYEKLAVGEAFYLALKKAETCDQS